MSSSDVPKITPGSAMQISSDVFMSKEQSAEIKDLGCLLHAIDKVSKPKKGTYVDITPEYKKNEWKGLFNDSQLIVNLMIRNHEVLAMQVTGESSRRADGQVTIVSHDRINLAINPPRDEDHDKSSSDTDFKVFVYTTRDEKCDLSDDEDVIEYVLRKHQESRKAGRKNIPFAEHVTVFKHLLRACYQKRSKEEQKPVLKRLRYYVFAVSSGKMARRLEFGKDDKAGLKKGHRFYETMTSPLASFTDDEIRSLPPGGFLLEKPTSAQLSVIRMFADYAGESDFAAGAEDEPVYDVRGRARLQIMLINILWHVNDTILALRQATSFERKSDQNRALKMMRKTRKIRNLVRDAMLAVNRLTNFLTAFGQFGEKSVLREHLKWLQHVRGLHQSAASVSSKGNLSSSPLRSQTMSTHPSSDHSAERQSGHSELSSDQVDLPSSPPIVGQALVKQTDDKADSDAEDFDDDVVNEDDDDEEAELFQAVSHEDDVDTLLGKSFHLKEKVSSLAHQAVDVAGWVNAALKYLHLICLHEQSLRLATAWPSSGDKSPAKQRAEDLVTRSKVSVIEFRRVNRNMKRKPLGKLIDELIATDDENSKDPLNKEDLTKLLGRPADPVKKEEADAYASGEKVPDDNENFPGELHCECGCYTVKTALHEPEVQKNLSKQWLESNGIVALETDLIKSNENMLPFMAVSKRCCPLCDFLGKEVAERGIIAGGKELLTPGKHTQWAQAALPDWTPRWLAEKCVVFMRAEARRKLNKLQKRINERRGSASPAGSANTAPERDTPEIDTPDSPASSNGHASRTHIMGASDRTAYGSLPRSRSHTPMRGTSSGFGTPENPPSGFGTPGNSRLLPFNTSSTWETPGESLSLPFRDALSSPVPAQGLGSGSRRCDQITSEGEGEIAANRHGGNRMTSEDYGSGTDGMPTGRTDQADEGRSLDVD